MEKNKNTPAAELQELRKIAATVFYYNSTEELKQGLLLSHPPQQGYLANVRRHFWLSQLGRREVCYWHQV